MTVHTNPERPEPLPPPTREIPLDRNYPEEGYADGTHAADDVRLADPVTPVREHYVTATPVPVERHTTATARRWAFDSAICGLVGVVSAVVGLIALARAGVDETLSDPLVDVVGFQHTALLGFVEVGVGAALLLAAAVASRGAAIFFGTLLAIAAFVGAIEADRFRDRLGLESSFAWLTFVAAVVVVVTALLVPRITSRTTTYDVE